MIVFLFVSIRINFFIVRRYEKETDLLDSVYFREHANFTRLLPGIVSAPLYVAHLISFVWIWEYCRRKKPYRDISRKEEVLQHFSSKEINYAKWFVVAGLIWFVHLLLFWIIDLM